MQLSGGFLYRASGSAFHTQKTGSKECNSSVLGFLGFNFLPFILRKQGARNATISYRYYHGGQNHQNLLCCLLCQTERQEQNDSYGLFLNLSYCNGDFCNVQCLRC